MGGGTGTGSGGSRSPFDDPFFSDFDSHFNDVHKTVKRGFGAFLVFWIVSAILGLVAFGVIIWAVIALVSHFTS